MADTIKIYYTTFSTEEAFVKSEVFIQEQLTWLLTESHRSTLKDAKEVIRLAFHEMHKNFENRDKQA